MLNYLKKIRDGYVIRQVNGISLPDFKTGDVIRQRVNFQGRVQKVGFRLEIDLIANRIGLSGWVKNLEDGSVEGEFQGERNKIEFLIKFMESLKRAKVAEIKKTEFPVREKEEGFMVIREEK